MQGGHGLRFEKMQVAEFGIGFVQAVMEPGPGDLKGSAKGIYIGRELGPVAQSDSCDGAFVHHHIAHFGVIANLDAQRLRVHAPADR